MSNFPVPRHFLTVEGNTQSQKVLGCIAPYLEKFTYPYECFTFPTTDDLLVFLKAPEPIGLTGQVLEVKAADVSVIYFDATDRMKGFKPFHRVQSKRNHPPWTQAAMFNVKIGMQAAVTRCAQQSAAWFRKGIFEDTRDYPWGQAPINGKRIMFVH